MASRYTFNSTTISDDARASTEHRPPYVSLRKWPINDEEFPGEEPRVVHSKSCRQIFLRSYTFSRKESVQERTKKCIVRLKDKVKRNGRRITSKRFGGGKRKGLRRATTCKVMIKRVSCASLISLFQRLLLSCTTKIKAATSRDS